MVSDEGMAVALLQGIREDLQGQEEAAGRSWPEPSTSRECEILLNVCLVLDLRPDNVVAVLGLSGYEHALSAMSRQFGQTTDMPLFK